MPDPLLLIFVGGFIVAAGVRLLIIRADARLPLPPIKVNGTVIAHVLRSAHYCTRVMMHVPEEDLGLGMCWGADVGFAYTTEEGEGKCTVSEAVLDQHAKGITERLLLESFAIGSARSIFAYPNGTCVLVAPPSDRGDFLAQCVVCWVFMLITGCGILVVLWEWYDVPIKVWFYYLRRLLRTGSGEKAVGESARKKKRRKDNKRYQSLIASAPLP